MIPATDFTCPAAEQSGRQRTTKSLIYTHRKNGRIRSLPVASETTTFSSMSPFAGPRTDTTPEILACLCSTRSCPTVSVCGARNRLCPTTCSAWESFPIVEGRPRQNRRRYKRFSRIASALSRESVLEAVASRKMRQIQWEFSMKTITILLRWDHCSRVNCSGSIDSVRSFSTASSLLSGHLLPTYECYPVGSRSLLRII